MKSSKNVANHWFGSLFAAALGLLSISEANAQIFSSGIVNVDFDDSLTSPYGPGAGVIGNSADYWNGVSPSNSGVTASGLLNTNSGITDVGFNGPNTTSGGALHGGTYGSLFDIELGITTSQVDQITGLTPNLQYNLYLYGPGYIQGINVNGVIFSSSPPASPQNSLVLGTGVSEQTVTADALGNLNLQVASGVTSSQYFSAFQLTPASAPEPSTWAMLLGGLGVLAFWRIRSRRFI